MDQRIEKKREKLSDAAFTTYVAGLENLTDQHYKYAIRSGADCYQLIPSIIMDNTSLIPWLISDCNVDPKIFE